MNIVDLKEEVREWKDADLMLEGTEQEQIDFQNALILRKFIEDEEEWLRKKLKEDEFLLSFKEDDDLTLAYQRKFKAKDRAKQRKQRNSLKWKE